MDVIKIALIIKKCRTLLNGRSYYLGDHFSIEELLNEQGLGQTVYFIKRIGPPPTDGNRDYSVRLIIPPDGKFFAEWNQFQTEDEILEFLEQ